MNCLGIVLLLGLGTATADIDQAMPIVERKVEPFGLAEVRLLAGPMEHAQQLDRKYLLSLDPDRLLLVFRLNAGIPSTAKPYGGWMDPKALSRGEFVGHYLSACAQMYAATGDEALKQHASQVVAGLAECQAKLGTGLVHAHPDTFSTEGKAPLPFWYQFHKVLAGMLDMHQYCGNQQALEVARKMGDWACAAAERVSDADFQKMLDTEHGGTNEAFANLYARTGDEKYLKLSQRFNHHAVLDPAMAEKDCLDGLHANTQIPKFLGNARQYEFTRDKSRRTAAEFFWNTVVHERSYAIGGNSDAELFSPKAALSKALSPTTCETCNTYNMLKLTRQLFLWEPKAEYGDYYERAMWNHILASQHPETGMMCYYVNLNGQAKAFGDAEGSFWCCYGTGMENHARYGEGLYFRKADRGLYVNQYVASELTWKELGLRLRQETDYPKSDTSRLRFICQKPVELTLYLRHPSWAVSGVEITVNGQPQAVASESGSFVALKRLWQTGDTVEIRMPMSLHTEGFADNPRRLAILYGPVVLTAPLAAGQTFPVIVTEIDQIPAAIRATNVPLVFEASSQVFRSLGSPNDTPVKLIPFYQEYQHPHIVYWDVLTESEWAEKQARFVAEQERQKALAARTVDEVKIGDAASETAHQIQSDRSSTGPSSDGHWRHAVDGGWFAYTLKVPEGAAELVCTYWGSDGGNRTFDILLDGEKLTAETLHAEQPGEFFQRVYPIPAERRQGKDRVTIRFQSGPGMTAGGVFGCRILRPEGTP